MVPGASLVAAHPALRSELGPQRARLLEGMVQAVAESGYAAATVTDAVRIARVSRGTFYALFASKEACFLEAYEHGVDVLVARIEAAVRTEPGDWHAKLRAALRTFLTTLVDEPRFARTYLLEIHLGGPRAQSARDACLRRFAERYRASFAAALHGRPDLRMPGDDALFVLAAGIDQLISARVRAGALRLLPELEGSLAACAVTVLEGTAHLPDHEGDPAWT